MISYPDLSPHETPTSPALPVPGWPPPEGLEDRPTRPYPFPPGAIEEPLSVDGGWWQATE